MCPYRGGVRVTGTTRQRQQDAIVPMGLKLSTGWERIAVGLGFTALFGLSVFANATFKELEAEIEQQDGILGACVLDLAATSRRLSVAVRERDFAISKFTAAEALISRTAGESTDKSFQILRHKDMIAALSAEVAYLKESRLKLEAVVLPPPKAEPKRVRRKTRKSLPAHRADVALKPLDPPCFLGVNDGGLCELYPGVLTWSHLRE